MKLLGYEHPYRKTEIVWFCERCKIPSYKYTKFLKKQVYCPNCHTFEYCAYDDINKHTYWDNSRDYTLEKGVNAAKSYSYWFDKVKKSSGKELMDLHHDYYEPDDYDGCRTVYNSIILGFIIDEIRKRLGVEN